MQTTIAIFIGGGIGSVARWLVVNLTGKFAGDSFPWGTLAVNTLGCLILGLLTGWLAVRGQLDEMWRLALVTGVIGGFTTFSAFSLDFLTLWQRGEATGGALGYVALTLAAGLLALLVGNEVFRLL
jgi:CrcB protein